MSKRTEVAILPIGCVEWHGPHLPTGIDAFAADTIAVRAAEIEPCQGPAFFRNMGYTADRTTVFHGKILRAKPKAT